MKKSLFVLEFKRVFLPTLAFLLATLGTLVGIEKVVLPILRPDWEGAGTPIDIILYCLLVLSGYVSGSALFSQEVKQKYALFLHSLPLDRGSCWLILVLSNLTASFLSFTAIIALRPSLLRPSPLVIDLSDGIPLLFGLLAFYFLYFASASYSLLFKSRPIAYIVSVIGTFAVIFEVFLFEKCFTSDPRVSKGFVSLDTVNSDAIYLSFCLTAFCTLFAFLAYRLFVSGEFHLLRMRLGKVLLLVTSQFAVFIVLALAQDLGMFTFSDSWNVALDGREARVSPRGDYLAILQRLVHHPQVSRVSVLETRGGKLLSRFVHRGIREIGWSSKDDRLVLSIGDDSPMARLGYTLPPSDSLT